MQEFVNSYEPHEILNDDDFDVLYKEIEEKLLEKGQEIFVGIAIFINTYYNIYVYITKDSYCCIPTYYVNYFILFSGDDSAQATNGNTLDDSNEEKPLVLQKKVFCLLNVQIIFFFCMDIIQCVCIFNSIMMKP